MSAKCIALDFDGVMTAERHYRWPAASLSFQLVDEARERGVAVCISTCNDTWRIVAELERAGYPARDDNQQPAGGTLAGPLFWSDPSVILVSNRKPAAYAYVDDRAVNHQHGQPTQHVWQAFGQLRTV
jgi:hypothetical protein